MRVTDVEPLLVMFEGSKDYGKPFGVKLRYSDGTSKRFTDLGLALCARLNQEQRRYIQNLQKQIRANYENDNQGE